MPEPVIRADGLSKSYRLGVVGRQTLKEEMAFMWHRIRGRDPRYHMLQVDKVDEYKSVEEDSDNRFWALKDVSFSVGEGEVVGIIGANGAGKSTLLKILTRVTEPSSGTAVLDGRVASLLEVGTGFHPELTGRDNIYLNGSILGMKREEIDSKLDEIISFSGVEKFINTPVKRYSSGMRVRLAFAVAAHLDPEIMLIDEVLAVGDLAFQRKCLGRMGEISRGGRTILFVSHNMSAVCSLCPRTIWIDHGRIRQFKETGRVVREYSKAMAGDTKGIFASRKGTGAGRVISVWLELDDGTRVDTVPSGATVSFVIKYDFPRPADAVDFDLVIKSERGERLFSLGNRVMGLSYSCSGKGAVRCKVPKLPLQPGSYEIMTICRHGRELLDKVSSLSEFLVSEGDFFGTDMLPGRQFGEVLVDQKWKLGTEEVKDV